VSQIKESKIKEKEGKNNETKNMDKSFSGWVARQTETDRKANSIDSDVHNVE
jgi:hypothetical protein